MSKDIYFKQGEAPKDIRYSKEFALHLDRMTVEGLHKKSAIALELAARDIEIQRLNARVKELEEVLQRLHTDVCYNYEDPSLYNPFKADHKLFEMVEKVLNKPSDSAE
jgi:hypothetical protein